MDGLIHEHKSRKGGGRRRALHIQRSMGATVDTSRALNFAQWETEPPEMLEHISSLKHRLSELDDPKNRRERRECEAISRKLREAVEGLEYWRWHKYFKAMPDSRRTWYKFYSD